MARKGHWQKLMPQKEGHYWVADREGHIAGQPHRVIRISGCLVELEAYAITSNPEDNWNWLGWWWSEPLPQPPAPPKNWDEYDYRGRPKKA